MSAAAGSPGLTCALGELWEKEVRPFEAQAICMGIFESAWFNRPVSLREIERCDTEGYQAEINRVLGIG